MKIKYFIRLGLRTNLDLKYIQDFIWPKRSNGTYVNFDKELRSSFVLFPY